MRRLELADDSGTLPERLSAAIRAACAARGDTDANRDALLAACLQLDQAGQADMLDHFRAEAERWAGAAAPAQRGAAT